MWLPGTSGENRKSLSRSSRSEPPCLNRLQSIPRREPAMPLLNIRPGKVDIQLSRTLGRMTQDLLKDGGRATGLDPECSC
jgi:hypothetical protein